MNEQVVETIASMWAIHPEAASFGLHWATLEQQLDAAGDKGTLAFAQAIRNRAAEEMKANASTGD